MPQSILSRMLRLRIFGKSPVNAYLRLNKWIWEHLPPSSKRLCRLYSYFIFLHALARRSAIRRQNSSTFFFRNRPELELIRRLSDQKPKGSELKLLVLACSNGAEVHSFLWTICSDRPDLRVITNAVDISKEALEFAKTGIYSHTNHELTGVPIFERITEMEMHNMFDREGDDAKVKSWLREGITWHIGDAGDPELPNLLGTHDMVFANRFLCHMDSEDAERCLRNIARFVKPGGYLFVSGVDLNIRMKVARDLGWEALQDSMVEIHDGDPSLRDSWPWGYWGLEPFNKRRLDWKVRYASAFRIDKKI